MEVLLVIVGLFFAITGAYSIITALNHMGKMQSDSSLDTKFFKFNAPIGFTYGILAIALVVVLIKYYDFGSQNKEIEILNTRIDSLKTINQQLMLNHNNDNTSTQFFKEKFSYQEPKSIFGGKVLVKAESGGFSSEPSLTFTGIIGASSNKKGPFTNNKIETEEGKRIYFMTPDSLIWGVNTINDVNELEVEIYKEK